MNNIASADTSQCNACPLSMLLNSHVNETLVRQAYTSVHSDEENIRLRSTTLNTSVFA